MDQFSSYDPMSASGQGGDQSKVPPPPPSYDQQVGIRSMESDMQSIQQTGGESPQSQILSAQEVFQPQEQSTFIPPSSPTPPMQDQFSGISNQIPVPPTAPSPMDQGVIMGPPIKKSPVKTILMVVGIVILAVAVGYGVYYLVNSLNATPEVRTPVDTGLNQVLEESAQPSPMASPIIPSVSPLPLTHTSLIPSPASSEAIALTTVSASDFKVAIDASAKQKLLVGTVKDISFTTESGELVTSDQFVSSFFPSAAPSLSFIFEQDFTAWLYGDKTGGNKFGVILPVKQEVPSQQLSSALTALETVPGELANFFVGTVAVPTETTFKEGPIGSVSVRYLSFSTKSQQVFEYAPVQINGKTYVIIASSYYQMSHMLKLLGAQPVAAGAQTVTP